MGASRNFLWSFPCYFLVANQTADPATGEIVLDDNIRFLAPSDGSEQHLAVFTDYDLADEFRQHSPRYLTPLSCSTPVALELVLLRARGRYRSLTVDVNRKTGIGRQFDLEAALVTLAALIRPKGQAGAEGI